MTGTPSETRARRWYVVRTQARQELLVAGLLERSAGLSNTLTAMFQQAYDFIGCGLPLPNPQLPGYNKA